MKQTPPTVFLLTDYGEKDEFAGIVRAVVARDCPLARIIDLGHQVPRFDVRAGALALKRSAPHLGPGVLLAVVDPGVGSDRRAIAVEVEGSGPRFLIGPDNGLLIWAAEQLGGVSSAVKLENSACRVPQSISTFDGRDVFAPAAAKLCNGVALEDLGSRVEVTGLVRLSEPLLQVSDGEIVAEVTWVDGFGNVQLSAGYEDALAATTTPPLYGEAERGSERAPDGDMSWNVAISADKGGPPPSGEITWNDAATARAVSAFSDLGGSELGLLVDANGHLAVVLNMGSAARELGIWARDLVRLRLVRAPG